MTVYVFLLWTTIDVQWFYAAYAKAGYGLKQYFRLFTCNWKIKKLSKWVRRDVNLNKKDRCCKVCSMLFIRNKNY